MKDRAGELIQLHGEKAKEVLEQEKISCTFAGRIVGTAAIRQGRLCGAARWIRPASGLSQERSSLGDQGYQIAELLDLGDWIGVTGILFRTKTNEFTVDVSTADFPQQSPPAASGKVARADGRGDPLPAALCRS